MYEIFFENRAKRQIRDLDGAVRARVMEACLRLADDPRPTNARKLRDAKGYRIRIGDYRALYEIKDEKRAVTIYVVGHRREVYRAL